MDGWMDGSDAKMGREGVREVGRRQGGWGRSREKRVRDCGRILPSNFGALCCPLDMRILYISLRFGTQAAAKSSTQTVPFAPGLAEPQRAGRNTCQEHHQMLSYASRHASKLSWLSQRGPFPQGQRVSKLQGPPCSNNYLKRGHNRGRGVGKTALGVGPSHSQAKISVD